MRAEILLTDMPRSGELAEALGAEGMEEMSKTSMVMETTGNSLKIKIEAEDVSSLRAAVNSYLRWLRIAIDTNDVIGGFEDE